MPRERPRFDPRRSRVTGVPAALPRRVTPSRARLLALPAVLACALAASAATVRRDDDGAGSPHSPSAGAAPRLVLHAAAHVVPASRTTRRSAAAAARATVCSDGSAEISPCTSSEALEVGKTTTVYYRVYNLYPEPQTLNVTCIFSGAPLSSCSTSATTMTTSTSIVLAAGASASFPVYLYASSTAGQGTLQVQTWGANDLIGATTTVTVTLPPAPPPLHLFTLSPHSEQLELEPGTSATVQFQLTNRGSDTATYRYTRSCAGTGVASGCSPSTGTVLLTPNVPVNVPVSVTASATPGTSGKATLTVARAADSTMRDSGTADVLVLGTSPGVWVSGVNPGAVVERNLCLTVAAGPGTAYECGDLRVAHALTTVRARNHVYGPVLLYNSQHAHPRPTVGAVVALPSDGRVPQTVSARLLDTTGAALATGSWTGSNWAAGSARRVSLSFDAAALPTNRYRYTLEITRAYSDGTSARDTTSGEFVVVNRTASEFGAGWWLAGFERVYVRGADLLWVGGDGSARVYAASGANTWTAPSIDRPDVIKKVNGRYERYLARGVKVQFDTTLGRHVATVDRLGRSTVFAYASSTSFQLTSITVPPGGSTQTQFTLGYDASGRVRRIAAPPLTTGARRDSLVQSTSGQLTTTVDPAGGTVSYAYDPAVSNRITSRTDERGTVTTYQYDGGGALKQASVALDSGKTIVTAITPAETRGLAGSPAVPLNVAYTKVDGPRTDVGDSTLFWLNRYGSPRKIRNALGDETILDRTDTRWPALVTRLRDANRHVVAATYDTRGHVATVTDSSLFGGSPARYARTTYAWDSTWDAVTRVVRPEGDSVRIGYDPNTGNRAWQEDGTGPASQVTFSYASTSPAAAGLLTRVRYPSGALDSLEYDGTLGNVSRTLTPSRIATTYTNDEVGRTTRVSGPFDRQGGTWLEEHQLDVLGRDILTRTSADGQAVEVRSHYDAAGNLDTLRRSSVPDPNAIGTLTTVYGYDRANRKVTETLVGQYTLTWLYDAAGNVLQDGRRPSTNTYDVLNRVSAKYTEDSAKYVYDAVGNLLVANNSAARVRRAYRADGVMVADTLRIATQDVTKRDFTTHVYAIGRTFDLDGRLRSLRYPGAYGDSVTYAYDPAAGRLQTVTSRAGNRFTFTYNPDGQLSRLARLAERPDSVWDTYLYDADGQLAKRTQRGGTAVFHNDSLVYDPRGKVVKNAGTGDTVAYSPLGATTFAMFSTGAGSEQYTPDPLGNVVQDMKGGVTNYAYAPGSGRLLRAVTLAAIPDTTRYDFDGDGALRSELHLHTWNTPSGPTATAQEKREHVNTYGGDRMLTKSRYTLDTVPTPSVQYQRYASAETYRYDALGRRVRTQVMRDASCATHDQASGCRNFATRTVWDGDQVLVEVRALGDTGFVSSSAENDGATGTHQGTVEYLHAGGIDAPLALSKNGTLVLPLTNWRGSYDIGTCPATACDGSAIDFPAGRATAYGDGPTYPNGPPSWYGGLITGQQDESGLQYRRNRYYDPKSGRFTQEDPIGLAGGLNLFGFANGDPVNFSDPFGLYIQPIQDPGLRRIIGRLLEGSPTFKNIWVALAMAPKDKVNLTIRQAVGRSELERVRNAGMGGGLTEGNASPDVTILLELIEGMQPGSAEGIIAHEFGHAAGKYTRKGAAQTGVPAVCGNADRDPVAPSLACAEGVRGEVADELSASQAKKEKKQ